MVAPPAVLFQVAEWALLAAAGAAGFWFSREERCEGRLQRLLAVLWPMGAVTLLVHFLIRLANAPTFDVNANRVANAVALARGYNIFPGADEGPLLDFMYGPMFAIAYTPAALAGTPSGAIWIGILLSFLFVVGPIAWFAFHDPRQPSRLLAASAAVGFGLVCMNDKALVWATWFILADAPTLALAGSACASLHSRDGKLSDRRMFVAALLAVLSVWSKQTAAPIVVALPLYVWIRDGWPVAFRFSLWLGATGLAVSASFVLWFGLEGLLFNMFQMPGSHPWKSSLSGKTRLDDVWTSLGRFALVARFPAFLALAVVAVSGRGSGGFRNWVREHSWTCLVLVALFMVPTATMAGAKIGGEWNVYGLSTYFLFGGAILGLAQLASSRPVFSWAGRMAGLALGVLLVFFAGSDVVGKDRGARLLTAANQLRNWQANPQERSAAFSRAHPDEVHFISNPLIGLYADGQLYSDMFGRYDRELAGYVPKPELMLGHAPSRLRYVVVRSNFPWFTKPSLFPEYADFTVLVKERDLPDHLVWERPRKPLTDTTQGAGK